MGMGEKERAAKAARPGVVKFVRAWSCAELPL
jgi:hypothetical protein